MPSKVIGLETSTREDPWPVDLPQGMEAAVKRELSGLRAKVSTWRDSALPAKRVKKAGREGGGPCVSA